MAAGRIVGIKAAIGLALLALSLQGCGFDYLNHLDRVTLHGGDAVDANLAAETTNPTKRSMYNIYGLGRNGDVIPPAPVTSTTATTAGGSTAPPAH